MGKALRDPCTLSNYDAFETTNTIVDFSIDFDKRILGGTVTLQLTSSNDGSVREIHLDTSYLDIASVNLNQGSCTWDLLSRSEPYGSQLKIVLDRGIEHGNSISVIVGCTEGLFFIFIKSSP